MPARIRRQQISALLWYRHHGPCRTDDAIVYFEAVAVQLAICCPSETLNFAVSEWVVRHTPDLASAVIAEVMDRVGRGQRGSYVSADLGRWLRLTHLEKVTLRISHIAACDVSPAEAKARKLAEERARVNSYRLATGKTKTPRERSIARTIPRQPGETTGSYYRRVKREAQAAAG